jgi:hypothetical protein
MCHCRVVAVDARAYAAAADAGKATAPDGWQAINPKTGAPVGIDKGFDYASGARANEPLQSLIDDRLTRLAAPIGSRLYQAMEPVLQAEQAAAYRGFVEEVLADPATRGRSVIAGAIAPDILEWLAARSAAPASAEIVLQDGLIAGLAEVGGAGEASWGAEEWLALRDALAEPLEVLLDTRNGRLVYILPAAEGRPGKLAIALGYGQQEAGELNRLVSAFRLSDDAIAAGLRDGQFLKVHGG